MSLNTCLIPVFVSAILFHQSEVCETSHDSIAFIMLRGLTKAIGSALEAANAWQLQQTRCLNVHEYQGAQLMSKFGINVPPGQAAFSIKEVDDAAAKYKDAKGEVGIIIIMHLSVSTDDADSIALLTDCLEVPNPRWRARPGALHIGPQRRGAHCICSQGRGARQANA